MLEKYVKKAKKEEEECIKFLQFKEKKVEEKIKNNIEKCYENIITNYLNDKLSNLKTINLEEKNKKQLISYIKNIIKNLKPSFKDLKDTMNINDYIKVKIIKYKDFSYSKVIDGFAMKKKACSKKMKEKQEDPKILLLQNLNLNEYKGKEALEDIHEESDESYFEEIIKKIRLLEVNIILVNKGINFKLLDSLLKQLKIIIIINVKPSALKKIARCTKGKIISNFKDLDINKNAEDENICGACKLFQISSVKSFIKEKANNNINYINDLSLYNSNDFNKIILSDNYKLMSFEGCDSMLFQTLLISGPEDLSEIKNLLKSEIFSTCREYFLQKKVLYFLFCNIPTFIKGKEKTSCKNFILNKEEMELNSLKNKQLILSRKISNEERNKYNLLDKDNIYKNNNVNNENISNKLKFSQIKSQEISQKKEEDEIQRKVSETTQKEKKLKNQSNNNIFFISDKILNLDKKTDNSNDINKLNDIINRNITQPNNTINRRASNYIKRNSSYITAKLEKNNNNKAYSSNKEKIPYHSYSNINESSNFMFNNPKLEKNETKSKITINKYDEKDIQKEEINKKENIISFAEIDSKKFFSDSPQKMNQMEKFNCISNKSILKVKENIEERNNKSFIQKKVDDNQKNDDNESNLIHKNVNGCYEYGFDTSPIITNKTCLKLVRLTMCKGETKLNNNSNNNNLKKESNLDYNKKEIKNSQTEISLTENTLLKSLNFICGDIQDLTLVYYNSEGRERDKPLGKFIIDMIVKKDSKCNKCKNIMLNHFYYFYNSNFSRIKIEYISNSDYTDSDLNEIFKSIDRENVNFKKYSFAAYPFKEIDYNINIFSYGFCKICKQIVTPLIKLPRDLFNYSSAKFFKHLLGNYTIPNRNDIKECNLTITLKGKCNHSSFHDINRIFLTNYGGLKFQYEDLKKYNLISIQDIPDIKSLNFNSPKEITKDECLEIIDLIKENFIYEFEEFTAINKIIKLNNLSIMGSLISPNGAMQINIIESSMALLKKIIDYLNEEIDDNNINLSSKLMPDLCATNNSLANNNITINTITNINKTNDIDNKSTNESEIIELKDLVSQIKSLGINNSTYNYEKELSKAPSVIEKEKNNFPNIISNLYDKKFDNYLKKIGLLKRIYFRVVQIKVLYNKLRTVINKAKILISLELIIREEEIKNKLSVIQNKLDNITLSQNKEINNKKENIIKNKISSDNLKSIIGINKIDTIKSKTPKIELKLPDKIIDNSKNKRELEGITGILDLEKNNSDPKDINSGINSNDIYYKNLTYNNENNNNSHIKNLEENIPLKFEPNNNLLKTNTENIYNDLKEDIIYENKLNLEKDNLSKSINNENEEKTNFSPESLLKSLIDKYISIFDYNQKYIEINENFKYSKMLKIILFYDECPNDFSSIIKENDLSSMVSYAISSPQYKLFIKEKTNLLDIKRVPQTKEMDKILPKLNSLEITKKDSIINNIPNKNENLDNNNIMNNISNPSQLKNDQYLYNTLLVFDSSNINFTMANTDKKNNNSNGSLETEKKKINQLLETELICADNKHFVININSLNKNKFKCKVNQNRKMTISRASMTNPLASPGFFSPKPNSSEKTNYIIESELDQIESKISRFVEELDSIYKGIKNPNKSNKLESLLKSINLSNNSNILSNLNVEESQNNNTNNNSNNEVQQKKKNLLNDFKDSLNNYIKSFKNEQNLIESIGKKYFTEDLLSKSEIEIVIYYPRQFEALRIAYCCTYEDLIFSITKSNIWTDVSGGKSKASFYKTNDEKYLFKSISQYEFNMFLKIAFSYFHYIAKYLFHNMPSLLMKILGVYKIKIKKEDPEKCTVENYYLMMMENLNYGLDLGKEKILSYDLKGSTINRYISKNEREKKENIVLLDNNFKEDFNGEPIPLERNLFGLILISVHNDALFLSKLGIIDYSFLLYINEDNKFNENLKQNIIRVGIIDYIRKYTWDKKIEHILKIIINGFNSPTIINPDDYKDRFISAIKSYFIGI